ncbi:MAG: hypothetical protein IKK30_01725 [Clostridia bacterium]|nr:hypothetical protein [Clostridia bacterium]
MLNYEKLSAPLAATMKKNMENGSLPKMAFDEGKVLRRDNEKDRANLIRTAFIRVKIPVTFQPR